MKVTIPLYLDAELAQRLEREAQKKGRALSAYVRDLIHERFNVAEFTDARSSKGADKVREMIYGLRAHLAERKINRDVDDDPSRQKWRYWAQELAKRGLYSRTSFRYPFRLMGTAWEDILTPDERYEEGKPQPTAEVRDTYDFLVDIGAATRDVQRYLGNHPELREHADNREPSNIATRLILRTQVLLGQRKQPDAGGWEIPKRAGEALKKYKQDCIASSFMDVNGAWTLKGTPWEYLQIPAESAPSE